MRRSMLTMVVTAALVSAAALHAAPTAAAGKPTSNQFWWPEKLDLRPLRQHGQEANPMGENFNYAD